MRDRDNGEPTERDDNAPAARANAPGSLTAVADVSRVVRGTVRLVDGTAAAKAEVHVITRRLRCKDETLGKSTTGCDGGFAIEYKVATRRVDIYVQASLGHATVTSGLIVNAGLDEVVDLVLGGELLGPTDYARVTEAIADILDDECGRLDELAAFDEKDLALLSAKSGFEPTELVLLRQATVLAGETKLSPALFYALGRQRIPLSLTAVLTAGPTQRRDAVEAALAANQLPRSLEESLDKELAALEQLAIAEALREPRLPGASTLGALLGAAGLSPAQRAALTAAHVAHAGSIEEFWKAVRDQGALTSDEVDRVQDGLRLGAMTLNHVPLVQALHKQKMTTPGDLARLENADWHRLVAKAGLPPDLMAAGVTGRNQGSCRVNRHAASWSVFATA